MPGIVGGIVGAITAANANADNYGYDGFVEIFSNIHLQDDTNCSLLYENILQMFILYSNNLLFILDYLTSGVQWPPKPTRLSLSG